MDTGTYSNPYTYTVRFTTILHKKTQGTLPYVVLL
jgi:hypothetical protein